MNTKHPFYGFTPERHAEIVAQLERMHSDLTAILAEYRRAAAPTNMDVYTPLTIEGAVNSLRQVRVALQEEQNGLRKRP